MDLRNNHQFDLFSAEASAYSDVDISGLVDFNDPSTIGKMMGLPPPKTMSPAEVCQEARTRSSKMFGSFDMLRQILERHESVIQKRWTKKTRQQRLKILLQAWPGMVAVHRPDFQAFRKESPKSRQTATRYCESYMWPYINQEDLAKPKTLLLLLNSRGRHLPCAFAAADGEAMHLGKVTAAIMPIFLNGYVMVMNGATNAEEYGKLVAWDDHPDAFEWMHTRKQFLPGEGLQILEVQERLLSFLLDCCKQVLHDIPELTNDAFPVLPEPQLKSETETMGFDSLAVMAAEAPYRVPAKLDWDRILSLLAARASAAEDDIWALREDPSYFAERLLDLREHRREMLKDSNGKAHPATEMTRRHVLWARIIANVLSEAYLHNEVCSELLHQARSLRSLQEKYAAQISPQKDLPEEYLGAILRFRHYLNEAAKGPMSQLQHVVVASPPLRRFFTRIPPDKSSSKIVIGLKDGIRKTPVEEELLSLLRTLYEDDRNLFLAGMPLVVDELERLLNSEPQAKELVSAHVEGIVGNLSIISQCLHQLNLYQPWANGYETQAAGRDNDIKREFSDHTVPWGKMLAAISEQNLAEAARMGEPTAGRFTYPVGKRRTKGNVEALLQAERNLDAFWACIDRLMYAKAGNLEGTATRCLLSQPRILHRTPEWVEPPPSSDDKEPAKTSQVEPEALIQPLSALYFSMEGEKPRPGRSRTAAPTKSKTKTQGLPYPSQPEAGPEDPESAGNPSDHQPTLAVDARAYKVFRTLFFNPEVTSTPGEIPWKDFLHAMASAGFLAEKLYGSVWQFSPTKLDVDRSIQFHEPHPRGKIAFNVARRFGRRLGRAYGWFGGMFVLQEK